MPAKYAIHTQPAPPRFRPIGKLGIVDWREDCSSCHNCVKRACVYGLYRDEANALHDEIGYLDYIYQCKGCLSCIQDCTKGILTRVVNPEYKRLGDAHYTPDIILTTWFQAATGGIPVSGSGYGGPFSGAGFDAMWTDMSEIVRPTRDGIHGREYINTSVDIGRKIGRLAFEDGELTVESPPLIESPIPLMFDALPERFQRGALQAIVTRAAARMGLYSVVAAEEIPPPPRVDPNLPPGIDLGEHAAGPPALARASVVPLFSLDSSGVAASEGTAPMAMVDDSGNVEAACAALKEENPNRIVAIRVQASPRAKDRVVELAREGAEVVHLVFDSHGLEDASAHPRHMRDVVREVHGALTQDGTRDLITLIVSGGIALPEHMAKAVICGADLVAIDLPLAVALECRLCGECERGERCPADLEGAQVDYGVQRITNLIGAWRNQLIEMLGAMGIREARRLRGETGRCMFFEDLERQTFGRLFGKRKEAVGAQ